MKNAVKVLILLFIFSIVKIQAKEIIRLGTSTIGGNYYELGKKIDSILSNNDFDFVIEVVNTEGSVDNIEKLRKNDIDMAIVQNDIAFLADNGMIPFSKVHDNIRGVITFYPEPIFLITNNISIRSIEQLSTYKVNVGPRKSGLFADVKVILNTVEIFDLIKKTYSKPNEIYQLLFDKSIDASFANYFDDRTINLINSNKFFVISLSNDLIQRLSKTYPYFDKFSTNFNNEITNTIAVKSILICNSTIDDNIIYQITEALYNEYNQLQLTNKNLLLIRDNVTKQMPLKNWHEGSFRFYNDINLLNSQRLLQYVWLILFVPMALLLLLLLANITFITLNKNFPLLIPANSNYFKFINKLCKIKQI